MSNGLTITPIQGIPLIERGDDLAAIILGALAQQQLTLQTGDVLVISSKIISKSEGRRVYLPDVQPSEHAQQVADETGKDPRVVELVLQESRGISRKSRGVLITQHRLGFVSANSGLDQSNVSSEPDHVLLLPLDPDSSAATLRVTLQQSTGAEVGIVISDTHGRPFRLGNVGVAIGVAGMPALLDLRGNTDLFGRVLQVSQQGYGDLVASAAHLVCGEGAEGLPVVLVRGLEFPAIDGRAADLNRSAEQNLY